MKTRKHLIALLAVFALASLACGLINIVNNATGGDDNYKAASSLWSDVPQMEGLKPSELESLPPFIKLALRLILGNLGRLNPQGEDQTTGNIDWIVFTADKITSDDVRNFYTNERMVDNGWDDAGQESTCVSGSEFGYSQIGAFCVFAKQKENIELAIIAAQDETTKQLNVFFLRLQANPTPVPTQ
jgi:hypothetical protein